MSRYEDLEGTGDYPAGGKRRAGTLPRHSSRADDNWDDRGSSRRGRAQDDPWAPPARSSRRSARSGEHSGNGGRRSGKSHLSSGKAGRPAEPVSRTRRILGRHPVVAILAILATLAITFVSLSAYAAYRNVYDSIHHVTVTGRELGKRPPKLNGSENILIIGSDSRSGTRGKYGKGIQGSRSDTSMLLHISPTHTGAVVVSFPRDTMVPILPCVADGQGHPGQQGQPGSLEQLNWAYSYGGAACLWKTLEQVTRIHIDHFVQVDFGGFKSIVNDVGGVPVCLPYAIKDPASRLNLPAGKSVVHGAQALAFVRERHIGLGSDLQRINRQQIFLASLAQQIKHSSSLSNPAKLYTLVHDVASSLTTDSGLTLTNMYAIANSLKGLSTSALQFIMTPVVPYPLNPNNQVELSQPSANQLFRAIARDNHILKTARRAAKAKAKPAPTVPPGKVQVQVLNGTSTAGLAATTASQLTARGFKVSGKGNASGPSSSTVIEYSSASQLPQVNTLAQQIPGVTMKQVPSLSKTTLDLVLGSGFKGVSAPPSHKKHKKAKSTSAAALSKNYGGVNGAANICGQSAAFSGPDTPTMFGN